MPGVPVFFLHLINKRNRLCFGFDRTDVCDKARFFFHQLCLTALQHHPVRLPDRFFFFHKNSPFYSCPAVSHLSADRRFPLPNQYNSISFCEQYLNMAEKPLFTCPILL